MAPKSILSPQKPSSVRERAKSRGLRSISNRSVGTGSVGGLVSAEVVGLVLHPASGIVAPLTDLGLILAVR